jgi:hypothetical protein
MTINTNKTKMLVFNKGGRLKNINIKYNNSSIECVQKYTYLGVVFNASGSFTTSKHEIHNKGNKALFKLRKTFPKLQHHCIFLITLSDRYSCMALKFWDIFLPVNISTI